MQSILDRMPKRATKTDDAPKGTETVRIDRDLARMLTVISIQDGVSVADILSPLVRDHVTARYKKVVQKMHDDLGQ